MSPNIPSASLCARMTIKLDKRYFSGSPHMFSQDEVCAYVLEQARSLTLQGTELLDPEVELVPRNGYNGFLVKGLMVEPIGAGLGLAFASTLQKRLNRGVNTWLTSNRLISAEAQESSLVFQCGLRQRVFTGTTLFELVNTLDDFYTSCLQYGNGLDDASKSATR